MGPINKPLTPSEFLKHTRDIILLWHHLLNYTEVKLWRLENGTNAG
jgi:hypothetical protein